MAKHGPEKLAEAERLSADQAKSARLGIAIINYMTQDIAVTARVLPHHMMACTAYRACDRSMPVRQEHLVILFTIGGGGP